MKSPLLSLDLFSGVGGLTLSLAGLVTPLVYCDVNPEALAVLDERMRTDVRTLTTRWLRAHVGEKPDAIVAGVPCIGFSALGKRQGFKNEESGLFSEVMRLVDDMTTIRYLFLENESNIVHLGMREVVKELHEKRGFSLCQLQQHKQGMPVKCTNVPSLRFDTRQVSVPSSTSTSTAFPAPSSYSSRCKVVQIPAGLQRPQHSAALAEACNTRLLSNTPR
jgi:hypothetical protein